MSLDRILTMADGSKRAWRIKAPPYKVRAPSPATLTTQCPQVYKPSLISATACELASCWRRRRRRRGRLPACGRRPRRRYSSAGIYDSGMLAMHVVLFCLWTARARVGRQRLAEVGPGRAFAPLLPPRCCGDRRRLDVPACAQDETFFHSQYQRKISTPSPAC